MDFIAPTKPLNKLAINLTADNIDFLVLTRDHNALVEECNMHNNTVKELRSLLLAATARGFIKEPADEEPADKKPADKDSRQRQ